MPVRPATTRDAAAIAAVYNHYIRTSTATFEEDPVNDTEMATRIATVLGHGLPWLVAEQGHRDGKSDGGVLGYAYATPWRPRSAYRFAAEVTVYVAADSAARGVGSALYGQLLPAVRAADRRTVLAGIALPNVASVALHERCGFTKVAHLERVGFKHDRWIDVGYWQRQLDPD